MTPISGIVLFDTNAASGLIRRNPGLVTAIDPSCTVILPLAVVGELLYGANHAENPEAQLAKVRNYVQKAVVAFPDNETAEIYGVEKAALRKTGRMIPENDLWIAATAIQLNLMLVTQDSHFAEVSSVKTAAW